MPARHSHPAVPATPPPAVPAPAVELVAALAAAAEEVPVVAQRLAPRFARSEARRHAQAYLWGLLSPVERKNGWQLAEVMGDRTADAMQHVLGRADWDPDAVRDDLRAYVVEHFGDAQAILVLDETAVVKKGAASAGVAKQYAGSVGKLENAQVGVFLAYASLQGVALLDRALYLPEDWTHDRARSGRRDPRGRRVRDQAGAGATAAGTGMGSRRPGRVGDRRQCLWRRPPPADVAGGPRAPPCAWGLGRGIRGARGHPGPAAGR